MAMDIKNQMRILESELARLKDKEPAKYLELLKVLTSTVEKLNAELGKLEDVLKSK